MTARKALALALTAALAFAACSADDIDPHRCTADDIDGDGDGRCNE